MDTLPENVTSRTPAAPDGSRTTSEERFELGEWNVWVNADSNTTLPVEVIPRIARIRPTNRGSIFMRTNYDSEKAENTLHISLYGLGPFSENDPDSDITTQTLDTIEGTPALTKITLCTDDRSDDDPKSACMKYEMTGDRIDRDNGRLSIS